MSVDLISSLGLTKSLPVKKFLLATKDDKSDLGFVFLDVLGHLIKNGYSILMVNLAQSFNHYQHLMSKCGVNLRSLVEKDRMITIDILSSTESIVKNSDNSENHSSEYIFCLSDSSSSMKDLYVMIEKGIGALNKQHQPGFILFVDEISVLQNLCIPSKEIQKLLHYCMVLCKEKSGFLLVGSQVNGYDHDSIHFMTYLSHIADMTVHAEGLSTGYSKDVHGKLWCEVKEDKQSNNKIHVLFKVEEKGVKLLPLGL